MTMPPCFTSDWQTDTITGSGNHLLNSFFHRNQTCVHCLDKTLANHLSQLPPSAPRGRVDARNIS
eukprot:6479231-Ditylum_brightwellii.AAC.1